MNEILKKTIEKNGITVQSMIAMEECAELAQAVSKCLRSKEMIPIERREHLIEEMADVLIVIEQLKIVYHITDDELNCWVESKVNRLEQRLSEK